MWWKLLAGLAGTVIITLIGFGWQRNAIIAQLGTMAAAAMQAEGISDGRAIWKNADGRTDRIARLAATATPAQRAAVTRTLTAQSAIARVEWQP